VADRVQKLNNPGAAGSTDRDFFGHPHGLGWLSATEFWERFSYYGMQALLVLYMAHRLLLPGHVEHIAGFVVLRASLEELYGPLSPQALASAIFGLYAGLVYVTPIAGGFLADRVLGRTRTVVLGACLMAAGHFLMASEVMFIVALVFLLIGAGCFKGNLAVQVGTLYSPGDPRVDDAYQLYYIAINLAVIASPLVCGTLGEHFGYHWGFGAAGAGMVIGLVIYLHGRKWLPIKQLHSNGKKAAGRTQFLPGDLRRVVIMLLLIPVLGASLVGNMQIFNAYLLWAEMNYQLQVVGMTVPVTWILSLSCIVGVMALAASALFWRWWAKSHAEPSEINKIAAGALMMACAPLILAAASHVVASSGQKVSLLWAVGFELVNDFGFANVAPVALALYSRSAPKSVGGMMTGAYYVLFFFANMLVGWLGGFLDRMPGTEFWLLHVAVVFSAALVLLIVRGIVDRALNPAGESIFPLAPVGTSAA
jgi:POT family proton-dependent oligopeptide transporter